MNHRIAFVGILSLIISTSSVMAQNNVDQVQPFDHQRAILGGTFIDRTDDFEVQLEANSHQVVKNPSFELSDDINIPTEKWCLLPNPIADELTVHIPEGMENEVEISLCDLQMNEIWTDYADGNQSMIMDFSGVSAGMYLLNIKTANHIHRKPISLLP